MSRAANSPNTAGAPETTMNATRPRAMQAGHQATWPSDKPANGQAPEITPIPRKLSPPTPTGATMQTPFCETEAA